MYITTNKVSHMGKKQERKKKGETCLVRRMKGGSFCRFKFEKKKKIDKIIWRLGGS